MNESILKLLLLSASLVALSSTACSSVAAYQRGRLAHFTMQPNDARSAARAHIHAIQEGASGGDVSASSGCGCN